MNKITHSFLIFLFSLSTIHAVCLSERNSNPFSGNSCGVLEKPACCLAFFKVKHISEMVYQFKDRSWSDSQIISRQWNFGDVLSGDKNFSFQRNPVHEFSGYGTYQVTLVITSSTNCRDSVTRSITVGPSTITVYLSGQVTNSENDDPIPGHPVSINADMIQYSAIKTTDLNGFYRDTIYNVPTGIPIIISVFDCEDSLHAQTVYSSSTPIEVNFSICAPEPCKAEFSAVLDSANQASNTFRFTDLSAGTPNRWIWSFGDGDFSDDQNPVHSYRNPGNYTVCLTILKTGLSGEVLCTDSVCQVISTPLYYNLGGLVFAGLFPINNPEPTGDTGVAYLYRVQNSKIIPQDTLTFTYLGYYAFLRLLEGQYLVKLGLKQGSAHYHEYIPAYTGSKLNWQDATTVTLSGGNSFSNDVHLVGTDLLTGEGRIAGYITQREDGPLIKKAEVILFNTNMEPVFFTYSDEYGKFEFPELEFGKYFLNPEITGMYSRMTEVSINEETPVMEGVVLEVSSLDFTGIPINSGNDFSLQVYPNPCSEELNLNFSSHVRKDLFVEITSLTGNRIYFSDYSFSGGNASLSVSLQGLEPGLYFLTVRSEDGKNFITRKIIRK